MNWSVTAQIAVLVIAYFGGIAAIGYYMGNTLGSRIDDMRSRIDDMGKVLGSRIDDLRSQMSREHDALSEQVGETNKLLIAHIIDPKPHNIKS